MPQLSHTGPEGKGSKTGRMLGKCKKTTEEQKMMGELGKGQGNHYHQPNAFGQGKRINYHQTKNNVL